MGRMRLPPAMAYLRGAMNSDFEYRPSSDSRAPSIRRTYSSYAPMSGTALSSFATKVCCLPGRGGRADN